jgi:hypothetical protein
MKSTFLVHIELPEMFSTRFMSLIPKQRAIINKLLDNKTLLSYSLDMERQNVWAFMNGKNEREIMDIISTFPIINDVKVNITELAFYDTAPIGLPELNMN